MANPSVVATDNFDNWSDVEVTNIFSITYTSTKSDTTVWQQAWGFEFSVSQRSYILQYFFWDNVLAIFCHQSSFN